MVCPPLSALSNSTVPFAVIASPSVATGISAPTKNPTSPCSNSAVGATPPTPCVPPDITKAGRLGLSKALAVSAPMVYCFVLQNKSQSQQAR